LEKRSTRRSHGEEERMEKKMRWKLVKEEGKERK
jgi:hypothetical protein